MLEVEKGIAYPAGFNLDSPAPGQIGIFFQLLTLIACSFAALWPKETHSISATSVPSTFWTSINFCSGTLSVSCISFKPILYGLITMWFCATFFYCQDIVLVAHYSSFDPKFPYGFLVFLMFLYGFPMVPHGSLRFIMAPYCSIRLLIVPHGSLWFLMAPYSSLWFLMVSYG